MYFHPINSLDITVLNRICWSPNWNGPQTDSGTPRFGILTNPYYPNQFGESQNWFGDCFFCVCFFFQSCTRLAFSHQTDNNTATTSAIPIFNARDALGRTRLKSARTYASSGRGAPRSSRGAFTPRCPPTRRKRRGRGFGGGTRWQAGRGPIGQLACTCWSAQPSPPPTSLATVPRLTA